MLVHDELVIRDYIYNIYPKLVDDEVLFISLSSRTKYLTEDQKSSGLVINRNEMFHRRFFNGNKEEVFLKTMSYLNSVNCASKYVKDLEVEDYLLDFKTSSGHPIPMNTVTVYVNINPSSMMKASSNLGSEMMKKMITTDYDWFFHLQSKLNTEVQKAKSRREFIDIDFDHVEKEAVDYVRNLIGGFVVQTHGGYHLLIPKKNLSKGYNLQEILNTTKNKFDSKEIVINKNGMIPLPGTYQGGKPVLIEE